MSKKNYPKKMPIIYKSGNKKSANVSEEIDNRQIPNIICYNKKTGDNYTDNLYLINELHKKINTSSVINNKTLTNIKNTTSNKTTNVLMESKNITNNNTTTNNNSNSDKSTDLCYNKSREELCEENYYILNEYSKLKDELENCKTKSINKNSNANTDSDGVTVRSIYQIIPRSYDAALVVAKYAGLNPNNLILDYFNSKPYAEITQREYFNNSNNLNSCLDMFKFILIIFLLILLFQIKKV